MKDKTKLLASIFSKGPKIILYFSISFLVVKLWDILSSEIMFLASSYDEIP